MVPVLRKPAGFGGQTDQSLNPGAILYTLSSYLTAWSLCFLLWRMGFEDRTGIKHLRYTTVPSMKRATTTGVAVVVAL